MPLGAWGGLRPEKGDEMRASDWVILYDGPEGLVLKDLNGPRSVTNDAEAVVSAVVRLLGPRRLFYFDSTNRLDELVVGGDRFDGFRSGAPAELKAALAQAGLIAEGE